MGDEKLDTARCRTSAFPPSLTGATVSAEHSGETHPTAVVAPHQATTDGDLLRTLSSYTARVFTGGSRLTRWAHGLRRTAVHRLLHGQQFRSVADFGCADGWLLRDLRSAGVASSGVGIDIEPAMVETARSRSASDDALSFMLAADVGSHDLSFDLVCCLETLEHVDTVKDVVDQMLQVVSPGGHLLVSVPVEVGPALLVKQMGRWWANRLTDYGYERYTLGELLRASALWDTRGVSRINNFSHKGFDYRSVRTAIDARATLVRTAYSPVRWTGPFMAATVLWLFRVPSRDVPRPTPR